MSKLMKLEYAKLLIGIYLVRVMVYGASFQDSIIVGFLAALICAKEYFSYRERSILSEDVKKEVSASLNQINQRLADTNQRVENISLFTKGLKR